MSTVNVNMTQEELEEYKKYKEEKDRKSAYDSKLTTYKELVDKTILESYNELSHISVELSNTKSKILNEFKTLIDLKSELFKVKSSQKSHSFINSDGDLRITVGYHEKDSFSDTVVEIIEKSYSTTRTKSFIYVEYRTEDGPWIRLPLNLTDA